jgi:hypothetical protein
MNKFEKKRCKKTKTNNQVGYSDEIERLLSAKRRQDYLRKIWRGKLPTDGSW